MFVTYNFVAGKEMSALIGWARVSTVDQSLESQVEQLEEVGEILSNVVYGIRRHSCLTDPLLVLRP